MSICPSPHISVYVGQTHRNGIAKLKGMYILNCNQYLIEVVSILIEFFKPQWTALTVHENLCYTKVPNIFEP